MLEGAILTASVLLALGFVLRAWIKPLQVFFVPASVVGGLLGLLIIQTVLALTAPDEATASGMASAVAADPARPAEAVFAWTARISAHLYGWPGPLIAVVFAGLLLEPSDRSFAKALRGAVQAGIYAWIIILGQIALGIAATWLVIRHISDVPAAFGQLIEAGFAGGHGTATALGTIYAEVIEFPAGRDLGLAMATIGLVYSVISGMVLVNVAVRRGWTRSGRAAAAVKVVSGLEQRSRPKPMAFARVRSEVIDPFVFQILIVAVAMLLGEGLRRVFVLLAGAVVAGDGMRYIENVPLFLFTLLGGWFLRGAMTRLGIGDLIDGASIKRIVAIAMEFLIVAAIASLRVEVVAAYFWPLALLCLLAFVWTGACLLFIARRVLPDSCWFELGIVNYGMSTGTTAQGMMLLRIVDEDLESGAAEDYALAAPLSAPFVGGGILTMSMPLILARVPAPVVVVVIAVAMVALFGAGTAINRGARRRPRSRG